jgi:GntR family transcriptional repressor for pyruvate dehydrogenase complex
MPDIALPRPCALTPSDSKPLGDQVYEHMLLYISSPAIPAHARLPGEVEMASSLGVSRPILRQALIRLRAEGHLYARKGSGNFRSNPQDRVHRGTFGPLTSISDIRQFLEFRCALEGECAALAAGQRDSQNLKEIQTLAWRIENAFQNDADGIDEDVAFHQAIAKASGNRFFAMTLAAMAAQKRFGIQLTRQLSSRDAKTRKAEVNSEHQAIVQAVLQGQPTKARAAMTAHLRGGIRRLFDG